MSGTSVEPLSPGQLQLLEQMLQRIRAELEEQLQGTDAAAAPVSLDQQSVGRLSRMDAIAQQQMAMANQSHVRAHLSRVERALGALADGDYGYCHDCDQPIGWGRLQIRPDSPLCVVCQGLNESGNMS